MTSPAPPAAGDAARARRERNDSGDRVWTVLDLLRWTTDHFAERGIESARLDAECLLAHALGVERLQLYLDFEKPVLPAEREPFRELVRKRGQERIPVAQLTGAREFWSLLVGVNSHVLIPRPETETLVSAALDLLGDRQAPVRILDLGTGSGAVALALASECPQAVIVATDISQEALKLAQHNAETLDMQARIEFVRSDWEAALRGPFDCVVSNPPYLADGERAGLAPELSHEPDGALFAGEDGLRDLERLGRKLPELLAEDGGVALELAPGQEQAVMGWLAEAGLTPGVERDLAGRPRVVTGRRGPEAGRANAGIPAPSDTRGGC